MFKKASVTALSLMVLSSTALAAVPQQSTGDDKASIGYSWHDFSVKDQGDDKVNGNEIYGSYKISDKFTVNAGYMTFNGDNYDNTYSSGDIQYKVNKNVSLLAGYGRYEREQLGTSFTRSTAYGGLTLTSDLNNKVSGYATGKFGNELTDWTVGLTYNINKDLLVDLNYRDIKANVKNDTTNFDAKADGVGLGLCYKF
ncbi:outer membrane beta-barrel protein [Dendrosporobacter sp. 1207_IL3150]|uniref:outer membrane beta-barrel protein n=1 Tax=Dendrosporobacter sp. 1207_IL3150 TaxID=3084054 RepID=UPI002FDB02C5